MEDARERGELQKSYFSLLHVVVHASLSESLLKMPPGALNAVMKAVTQSASTHVDAAVRRTCLQVCVRVGVGCWDAQARGAWEAMVLAKWTARGVLRQAASDWGPYQQYRTYQGRACLLAGSLVEIEGCRGMLMRTNIVPPS